MMSYIGSSLDPEPRNGQWQLITRKMFGLESYSFGLVDTPLLTLFLFNNLNNEKSNS